MRERTIPGSENATVLHVIADTPDFRYTPVALPSVNPEFRYLRYVSSDSTYGNMAEVEFLNQEGKALRGKVMGGYKPSIYYPRNGAEMLSTATRLHFSIPPISGRGAVWNCPLRLR